MHWRDLGVARLGLGLLALTAVGWLTGAPYLLTRLGLPFPPGFAHLDLPHAYVGAALAVVLGLKVFQLHARHTLARLAGVLAWQRWVSTALLLTYGGVLLSGALLVAPWPATVQRTLVNLHLLTAAWAGVVTLAHIARYVARRVHVPELDLRLGAGVALGLLPALALAIPAEAASPLARLGDGAAWTRVGPAAAVVTKLAVLPGGDLVAAGTGLWVSHDGGRTWTSVAALHDTLVRGVSAGPGGSPVYVATERGVLVGPSAEGPFAATALTRLVDSVLADPAQPGRLWAGGAGLWTSADGGSTWAAAADGLTPQGSVWTIARFGAGLFAGTTTGIYRWTGTAWQPVSALPSVYSLDAGAGGEVWASSMGGGVEVLRGGRWVASNTGLAGHAHGGGAIHVDGVTLLPDGRLLAATMDQGIAESTDGGRTWSPVSAGFRPGSLWQVVDVGGRLLAASGDGIYSGRLLPASAPGVEWWALVLAAALLFGGAGGILGGAVARRDERRAGGHVRDHGHAAAVSS